MPIYLPGGSGGGGTGEVSSGTGITVGPTVGDVTPIAIEALTYAIAVPQYVIAAIDQSESNTTAINDDELRVTVDADGIYEVDAHIFFEATAAADFKAGFSGSTLTGATMKWGGVAAGAVNSSALNNTAIVDVNMQPGALGSSNMSCGGFGIGTQGQIRLHGILTVDSVGGDFGFAFAQVTNDAGNPSIRKAGSLLVVRRLA
jgi:hypothetical protein